jgi:DNA-binding Xre family transcriptional regulator
MPTAPPHEAEASESLTTRLAQASGGPSSFCEGAMPWDFGKIKKMIACLPAPENSISAIARKMGVAQPNMSRKLSGKNPDVPLSEMEKLAKVMGCRVMDFLKR